MTRIGSEYILVLIATDGRSVASATQRLGTLWLSIVSRVAVTRKLRPMVTIQEFPAMCTQARRVTVAIATRSQSCRGEGK